MLRWFIHQPAYRFLTADEKGFSEIPSERLKRTWQGLFLLGFLWGLASIGLWHGGRWLFGQPTGMYLLPNLIVILGMLLWLYRRAAGSLIRFLAGKDAVAETFLAVLLSLLFWGSLMVLRPSWHMREPILPVWMAWLRPESKLDRLLLLMPLWGTWSMLILLQFRRPSKEEPALRAIARNCGPLTTAILMGVLLVASIGYFAYLPWTQLTIPAAGILVGIGGGLLMVRRNGGLDRSVLLATNLLTQLALLLAVVANSNVRRW